ncbi:tyrosine-type recombinase/integrase [Lysinibacillus sp. NPDC048646]|uniref:tyrosine-type recombinase/integrase n=1 Tax=Lysinibacillus sp. NPDC048646 TaxID=3390574 RepID=UPI003D0596D7
MAINKLMYVEDITVEALYYYLDVLKVTPATKLIRLKSTKAVLSKFYNNGWIKEKFWYNIHIKIDKEVKKGAKESDIDKLLELIDQTSFIGFRGAVAIKLMYKTGIRIRTLGEFRERHIDFDNLCLNLDGSTLKNHKFLKLPIDKELADMLQFLIKMNDSIRSHFGTDNHNAFITQNGLEMNTSKSSNCAISKQLNKYSKRFGLANINAHA